MSPLRNLSSDQLLAQLAELAQRGAALEAELLAHLGEVDARRLYLREGCSSMFSYCVGILHFAEGCAYKRITAARAARRHPRLLQALRDGELHVTAVSLLAPQLTPENSEELVAAARGRTSEEIRRMLADRQPKPVVPASVRRAAPRSALGSVSASSPAELPRPATASADPAVRSTAWGAVRSAARPAPPAPARRARRARTEPLGNDRYLVRFTVNREVNAQLQELRALMRHTVPDGDVGEILARALALLLKQVRRQKFGACPAPHPAPPTDDAPSRSIPAAIRREVAKRDAERCSFVAPTGRRCGGREFLEFPHREPWAGNRTHSIDGIELRCRAHNQYAAERDFGEKHMARFRSFRTLPGARPTAPTTDSATAGSRVELDLNPVDCGPRRTRSP